MSAKDIYHDAFVRALQKDGWTIMHDPLTISVEGTNLLIDVGAERVVTAQRAGDRKMCARIPAMLSPERVRMPILALRDRCNFYALFCARAGSTASMVNN